jgi:hypothetical protein
MKSLSLAVIFAFAASFAQAANAECVLEKNTTLINETGSYQFAYLYSLTREEFEKAKNNATFSGSIKKLIGASGSYDDLREMLQRVSTSTSIDISTQSARQILESVVSQDAVVAYKACLGVVPFLAVFPRNPYDDALTLRAVWKPQLQAKLTKLKTSLIGGKVVSSPGLPVDQGHVDYLIQRERGKTLVIVVEAVIETVTGGSRSYTDSIVVPWVPKLVAKTTVVERSTLDPDLLIDDGSGKATSPLYIVGSSESGGVATRAIGFPAKPEFLIDEESFVIVRNGKVGGGCEYGVYPQSASELNVTSKNISGQLRFVYPPHCGGYSDGLFKWKEIKTEYVIAN